MVVAAAAERGVGAVARAYSAARTIVVFPQRGRATAGACADCGRQCGPSICGALARQVCPLAGAPVDTGSSGHHQRTGGGRPGTAACSGRQRPL
ncbi:MAG TPA: hypothetical protein ENK23_01390 [Sorangium sp.]|nr:hypothetical protein [Sorangium sp.]